MKIKETFIKVINKYFWVFYVLLICVLCFLCFFKLGTAPVQEWDEARHGVNAFEMISKNNYIANYYNGNLDYWNLKPPISYYFVILGYKIFGYNTWGLRFFSAFAYLILVVLVSLFLYKKVNKYSSLISIIMFCGSYFFFQFHFIRAGDADALFILFIGIALISLVLSSENTNWLYLTGGMFSLAFLTKSWHAFVLAPIVLFYFLFTKGYKHTKWWQYILAFLSATLPIAIWVFARFKFDGLKFFEEMLFYDLINRSSNAIEGHYGSVFFYVKQLLKDCVSVICLILITIGVINKLENKEKLDNLDKLSIIGFLSIFIIFSIAKTKLEWYIFPICVPLILSGSIYMTKLFSCLANKRIWKHLYVLIMTLVLFASVGFSCISIFRQTSTVNNSEETQTFQEFILSLEITDSNVYYQTHLPQDCLLCLEWKSGKIPNSNENQEFENTPNSYLIIDKENYSASSFEDNILIIKSNGNYLLLYNPQA